MNGMDQCGDTRVRRRRRRRRRRRKPCYGGEWLLAGWKDGGREERRCKRGGAFGIRALEQWSGKAKAKLLFSFWPD
jgi:hypothetical protein